MNSIASFYHPESHTTVDSMNSVIKELDHLKRQAAHLARVNELHARLAGEVGLPGMIEAFSVWLMPLVAHDLIVYDNPQKKRQHMFCSCHGPHRRQIMQVAQKVLSRSADQTSDGRWRENDYFAHNLPLRNADHVGNILLFRHGKNIGPAETALIKGGLDVLQEPLCRALEYENLFEQACQDSLTGLANRRVFETRIDPLIDRARRHDQPLTIAAMDLDHFKQINDSYGHAAGDKVLQNVANIFAKTVRSSDLLVRMGGDEFLLVLPDTDLQAAKKLAERLCQAVTRLDIRTPAGSRLGISIGVVQWTPDMSRKEWLLKGDEVLYQAKSSGKARVCVA